MTIEQIEQGKNPQQGHIGPGQIDGYHIAIDAETMDEKEMVLDSMDVIYRKARAAIREVFAGTQRPVDIQIQWTTV